MTKFQVVYERQKKKGTSVQKATFFYERDALMWAQHLKRNNIESEIVPIF